MRQAVIVEMLKLNKNGISKFTVKLDETYGLGKELNSDSKVNLWVELQLLFIIFTLGEMERRFHPTYMLTLVESYKTRKDYDKIWPDILEQEDPSDNN